MPKFVFWLGPAPSPWDPLTAIEEGIGGSETAAIHLSRELALLGHQVVVYADIHQAMDIDADDDGKYPCSVDVEWLPYRKMPAHLSCDVFVSSRQPEARQRVLPSCRQAWLWMHDAHCGPDWENSIGRSYDRVLCLSNWARTRFLDYYPGVRPEKVQVTSNGLDTRLFEPFEEASPMPLDNSEGIFTREPSLRYAPGDQHVHLQTGHTPLRATFSSSPDRGLSKLLDLWPEICSVASKMRPEGLRPEGLRPEGLRPEGLRPEGLRPELHVYYGFENWRKIAERHGAAPHVLKQIDRLEKRVSTAPGVVYHGRAGQLEVARSYLRSQLWLYPTDFEETSCITAMEAQAAGCKVVATRRGAVPETSAGGYFTDGPTTAPGFDARFLELVWAALNDDTVVTRTPRSWTEVARQWEKWL
jgi:glycosyltransferase involved in cell wall biosynthesis